MAELSVRIAGRPGERTSVLVDDADVDELRGLRLLVRRGYVLYRERTGWKRTSGKQKIPVYVEGFLHRRLLGLEKGDDRVTDHINRDPLDNRRANLRIVTRSQNAQNIGKQDRKRPAQYVSKARGVHWDVTHQKWKAAARLNGTPHVLGYFDDETEAAEMVSAWRARHMPFAVEGRGVNISTASTP